MPPKRALIVVSGMSEPSSMVRAQQYQSHFDRSDTWRAQFIGRRSPTWTQWSRRTFRPTAPLVVPLIHRPVVAYTKQWEQRREDEIVRLAAAADLVYIVKLADLRLYQRLRALNGPVVIADFNDGLWLPAFQASGWKDLDAILATAHGVICENPHVADYARRHNPNVAVVPDSPQLEAFDRARDQVSRDPATVTVGWIGSPENVGSLYRIWEPLEAVAARVPGFRLRVVGARADVLPRFERVQWSCRAWLDQSLMVREALAFDIGVFPMFHVGDGLARGTLKAMIYMSAGAATIAENYGENRSLIQDGVNGALAGSPAEWEQRLQWLISDRDARTALGRAGLETIRTQFSAPVVFAQLQAAFSHLHHAAAATR